MSSDVAPTSAIAVRAISKRYAVGAGTCTASVTALRGASAEIRLGEVLVVAGDAGAGKTTLLLCAAGLLSCDAGDVAGTTRRVVYRDLALPARPIDPLVRGMVLLLDTCDHLPELARARATRVIGQVLALGGAVVLAGRDAEACIDLAPVSATIAVVHLRLGETRQGSLISGATRVAETWVPNG
jgi:ABC-type cobalamin/Fe3+-siderophores transport system ATPase subunit